MPEKPILVLNLLVFDTPKGLLPVGERLPHEVLEASAAPPDSRWEYLKRKVIAAYRRLQDQLDHGEVVCNKLRRPERIRVVHSAAADPAEVEKKLRGFLEVSYSRHTRWLVVDGILSLLGGLLMPLPGPNVFFFYPAARTFGHYLARSGAQRASQNEWELVSEPLLEKVEEHWQDLSNVTEEIESLEAKYNLEKLHPLLIRLS